MNYCPLTMPSICITIPTTHLESVDMLPSSWPLLYVTCDREPSGFVRNPYVCACVCVCVCVGVCVFVCVIGRPLVFFVFTYIARCVCARDNKHNSRGVSASVMCMRVLHTHTKTHARTQRARECERESERERAREREKETCAVHDVISPIAVISRAIRPLERTLYYIILYYIGASRHRRIRI
jgi:hypothetical protein